MGHSVFCFKANQINMKFLVLAALVAVADADAEPGYGYGGYGYGGRGYGRGYYGKRSADAEADAGVVLAGPSGTIATTSYAAPVVGAAPVAVAAHTYAAPALTTSYGYGLGYSAGYPYGSLAYAAPYANFGAYYGKRSADAEPGYGYGRGGYGRGYYGKREAEAEPGYGRGGYGYGGRGYGRGYYGKRDAEAEPGYGYGRGYGGYGRGYGRYYG